MRRCPRCEETKEIEDFGRCQAREDGLNLYCRECTRAKTKEQRMRLKARRKGAALARPLSMGPRFPRRPAKGPYLERFRRLGPEDRVLRAIRAGARTYGEIVRYTRMTGDEVSDAIAELLLWRKTIGTRARGGRREYFERAA